MILQQLSYSDINPEQLDVFSCLFFLKNKSFATKIHIQVQIAYLWTGQQGEVWDFWQNHVVFVVLKRNGPSLRTLAEPEAEVKGVKLCFFFFFKKKSFIQINPTSAGQFCFSVSWYKLKESTGTAGLQHKKVKPKDPATNLDHGKLKFKAPAAAPAASPGAGEVKPQAPAATPAILVPRKTKPEPQ